MPLNTRLKPYTTRMAKIQGPRKKTKKKIPNQRKGESKKGRKFPIEEWEKAKKKENFQSKSGRKAKKKKKIPDQGLEENRRNVQKGLWTRQHLNNTELSPSK